MRTHLFSNLWHVSSTNHWLGISGPIFVMLADICDPTHWQTTKKKNYSIFLEHNTLTLTWLAFSDNTHALLVSFSALSMLNLLLAYLRFNSSNLWFNSVIFLVDSSALILAEFVPSSIYRNERIVFILFFVSKVNSYWIKPRLDLVQCCLCLY